MSPSKDTNSSVIHSSRVTALLLAMVLPVILRTSTGKEPSKNQEPLASPEKAMGVETVVPGVGKYTWTFGLVMALVGGVTSSM